MSSADEPSVESANHAMISASDQESRYTAALHAARELNTAPTRSIKPFSALSQSVRQLAPVLAVGAAGIVAAGIAAVLNSSRRARDVERRESEQANTALQVVSVSQIVVYRSVSIRLEIFDRRDDLAGKRF